jgi:NADP-reducing hydrogenase subunit HndB
MPKLKDISELRELRQELQGKISRRQATNATITVGMGTCGIAAGARETMQAILSELERRDINVHVTTVGCIGMCSREPLVDIQLGDEPRVTYGDIAPERVPRLIEEHVVNSRVVDEWVVGRVGEQGE